ncbi:MAG: hypothetical protein FWC91_11850 [Defluviitaleaceae bacterium]|nr:hypothetical protein [Defluviitaleaceae bacterium]
MSEKNMRNSHIKFISLVILVTLLIIVTAGLIIATAFPGGSQENMDFSGTFVGVQKNFIAI